MGYFLLNSHGSKQKVKRFLLVKKRPNVFLGIVQFSAKWTFFYTLVSYKIEVLEKGFFL